MPTIDQLNALAQAVPDLNKRAATKAQAGKTVALQQSLGAAQVAPGANTLRAAQAVAPQAVGEQAAVAQAAGAQTQQQLAQIGGVGLQTQAAAAQDSLANQEITQKAEQAKAEMAARAQQARADIGMRKRVTGAEQASAQRLQQFGIDQDNKLQIATLRQREQLDRLGGDVKDQIIDSRMKFERDDMGRKFTNQRQLADYSLANAKTQQEFADKMREMQQVSERKIQLLETAERRLREAVARGFMSEQQQLDNISKEKILEMASSLREQAAREQAAARNRGQIIQTAFTIGGAVVGGLYTGGAGAPAGAAAGAAIGTGVGGVVAGSGVADGLF